MMSHLNFTNTLNDVKNSNEIMNTILQGAKNCENNKIIPTNPNNNDNNSSNVQQQSTKRRIVPTMIK